MADRANEPGYGLRCAGDIDNYYAWLAREMLPYARGRVVEHGAGTGALSAALVSVGVAPLVLTEPDPSLARGLAERFAGADGVTTFHGTLEGFLDREGGGAADAIVSSNVLEHIEDDVACLRAMNRLLRPGGTLALYVPARPELYGELDRAVGHVRRYRLPELRSKLDAAGLRVERIGYRNLIGAFAWFVMGRVLKKGTVEHGSAGFYDRFIFPVSRAVEDLAPPPYGQNLLAFARKPTQDG